MLFIMFIITLTVLFLVALERERQRRAKHRAQTDALLAYVESLPVRRALARAQG